MPEPMPTPAADPPAVDSSPAKPISFRLDPESSRVLLERARHLRESPGELARRYVVEALYEREERENLHLEMAAFRKELETLRSELADTAFVLLTSAGKVASAEAETWVNENLNQPCSPSPSP